MTSASVQGPSLYHAPNEKTSNLYSEPSSGTAGFFQTRPTVNNQFYDDLALRRVLDLHLPAHVQAAINPDLAAFGDKVLSKRVLNWVADAEKNTPYLRTWDTWGKRIDELITSEGWRNLQGLGIAEGMVAIPYENIYAEHSRVYYFAKYHLWCGSSAWVNCPSLMTDGAASMLQKYITEENLPHEERQVLTLAYHRLVSRNPAEAWTTGQWMTERPGGSDVSNTETLATYMPEDTTTATGVEGSKLGPWQLNGFKWFSSATDSQMMVLLGRTPRGVSLFYAPMRRTIREASHRESELNGIAIQRMKNKLGTRALPTAELELTGMRAWLVGEEGRGTKQIAAILNIARIHNAMSAVGFWGRGLGISRAFAKVRQVGKRALCNIPAHIKTMAKAHVEYRANLHITAFVVALQGLSEQSPNAAKNTAASDSHVLPPLKDGSHILRLLTPVVKGLTSKAAITGLQECMESLGGVGYLENDEPDFNIARLYRDANVLPIWEGTTDMMADDVYRVIRGKTGEAVISAMDHWVDMMLLPASSAVARVRGSQLRNEENTIGTWWRELMKDFVGLEADEFRARGRELMERLGNVVSGALLIADAHRDGDGIAAKTASMWVESKTSTRLGARSQENWQERSAWERRIVFGEDAKPLAHL